MSEHATQETQGPRKQAGLKELPPKLAREAERLREAGWTEASDGRGGVAWFDPHGGQRPYRNEIGQYQYPHAERPYTLGQAAEIQDAYDRDQAAKEAAEAERQATRDRLRAREISNEAALLARQQERESRRR